MSGARRTGDTVAIDGGYQHRALTKGPAPQRFWHHAKTLAIARLHHELLALDTPPLIRATHIEEREFIARYGEDIGRMCYAEAKKKSFDRAGAEAFNRKLADLWPQLREELKPMLMDPAKMKATIAAAGGPTTATELGLDRRLWRNAMKFARDVRNRWSFLDLADDAGLLDDFLDRDEQ